jgi:uncharacterized protein YbaR (Trm112 family)/predicted RNA-binding Zn-ribbon protein involved in translation (DUF1610 family)
MEKIKLIEGIKVNKLLRKQINKQFNISSGGEFAGEMIWISCPECKTPRWVRPDKTKVICTNCNRKKKMITLEGYEVLSRNDYFKKFGIKRSSSMIYYPCVKCGEKHWMARADLVRKSATGVCRKCFNKYMSDTIGEKRWNFNKNYRVKYGHGYIQIRIKRDDPYACMAANGTFIAEHRYIMAKHLGRPLTRWELVHHKNCKKDDNRIENLQLVTLKNHKGELVCPHCGGLYHVQ